MEARRLAIGFVQTPIIARKSVDQPRRTTDSKVENAALQMDHSEVVTKEITK
jgi:hypothetical protein